MVVYQARNLVTSPGTAASLLRFAASPAGLVTVTALKSFFDWYTSTPSPAGGDISPDGQPMTGEGVGSCPSGSVLYSCPGGSTTSAAQCHAQVVAEYPDQTWTGVYLCGGYLCHSRTAPVTYPHRTTVTRAQGCPAPSGDTEPWNDLSSPMPVSWQPYVSSDEGVGSSPLSDAEFYDRFMDSPYYNDEPSLKDILTDQNGVPWDTPENQAMRQQIQDELDAQTGQTSPSIQPGTSANPDDPDAPLTQPDAYGSDAASVSPGGGSQTQTEVPAFCDWAGIVCDWIGWTQEPAEDDLPPALPVETVEPGTWTSGLSGGACPVPIVVSALGASVSLSWQPACDFVTMLRPILIAFAGIAAALILLGQRAGGAG